MNPPKALLPPNMGAYGSADLAESGSLMSQLRHLYSGEDTLPRFADTFAQDSCSAFGCAENKGCNQTTHWGGSAQGATAA